MTKLRKIYKNIDDFFSSDASGLYYVCAVFFGFTLFLIFSFWDKELTLANWSYVGASFGILSALFTGAAFAVLIITMRQQKRQLIMQSEELKLQRKELKATRKVLKKQNNEFRIQSDTMKRQQFEGTFFKLIKSFNVRPKFGFYEDDIESAERDDYYTFINKIKSVKISYDADFKLRISTIEKLEKILDNYLTELFIYIDYDIMKYIDYIESILNYMSDMGFIDEKIYRYQILPNITELEKLILFYLAILNRIETKSLSIIQNYKIFESIYSESIPREHIEVYKNFSKLIILNSDAL